MKLKAFYKTKEEIPEKFREEYTEQDGLWVLDAEVDEHPAVQGLKNTVAATRTDRQKIQDRLKQFEGLDMEYINKILKEHSELEEGALLKKGDIEGIVGKRTDAMRKEFQKTLDELTSKYTGASEKLRTLLIDNGLAKAASAIGVRAAALDDFLARGQRVWKLDEAGNPVPMDQTGNVIFGKDGRTPMTQEEWAHSIAPNIQHLLEPSNGGGARDGAGRQGNPGAKIIAKDDSAGFGMNLEAIAKGEVKVQ